MKAVDKELERRFEPVASATVGFFVSGGLGFLDRLVRSLASNKLKKEERAAVGLVLLSLIEGFARSVDEAGSGAGPSEPE